MTDPACNGAEAVGVFPGSFGPLLQFFDTHPRRAKHDMLAIIEFPITREQPAFSNQSFVESGVRERCDDGKTRQINSGLNRELCRLQKHIRLVVVQTENEAALQSDTVL